MMLEKGESNQILGTFESRIQILPKHNLLPEILHPKLIQQIPKNSLSESEAPNIGDFEVHAFEQILYLLNCETGHDFSLYKKKTINRRIHRRMAVCHENDIIAYASYLDFNRPEVKLLFNELLIGVTNFFREPEAFDSLKNNFIIPIMKDKSDNQPLRVWVPGCATGEEVYSLAILFKESMEELGKRFTIQIFGTDIDEAAICAARGGLYPPTIASDVGDERLKSYFTKLPDGFRIKKDIRKMIAFGLQSVTKDPPFIKMDLISCRNLFIYLEPELKQRIIPLFHNALKPGGGLFLGHSETIGGYGNHFEVIDKKWKIFRRPRPTGVPNG